MTTFFYDAPSQNLRTRSLFFVIFSLALGAFCIGTTEFLAMGLIQEIAREFQIKVPAAGHFISAYALGVTLGAPIIAIITAKTTRKTLLIGLMLCYGLANVFTIFSESYQEMLFARFLAGLPHGAYLGIAALVAAELAGPKKRASAVAQVMLGLTIATVIGAPFATWLGQHYGWYSGFGFSAAIAFLTMFSIIYWVPRVPSHAKSSVRNELAGLININMWLTLAVGAIGVGGLFSVYSYVSPILTRYTQVSIHIVPIALSIWGIGMVLGGVVAGWLADKNLNKTLIGVLVSSACAFSITPFLMSNIYTAITALFFIGFTVLGLAGTLQTRLMDIAGDSQSLAASLNHSALNIANALGAFLGGWVLSHHYGWLAPIWVGTVLSVAGLVILYIAFAVEKIYPSRHQKH